MRRTAMIAVVGVAVAGTLNVYWTRTPEYTLLHLLQAHASADRHQDGQYVETEFDVKSRVRVSEGRTEPILKYVARLQETALARTYAVEVQESHTEGETAVLTVKVEEKAYELRFHEYDHGHWKLIDFLDREDFLTRAIKGMRTDSLFTLVRL